MFERCFCIKCISSKSV
ncbi:hypothetical protein VCEM1546_003384A, partial [Vibrio cholerae O1 str. EM-1546]